MRRQDCRKGSRERGPRTETNRRCCMIATHANRGRSLETTVIASQCGVVALERMPTAARLIRGKWTPMKSPVDYIGTVCGTGRAIMFDAKQSALATRFKVGDRDHIPEHQRQFLLRQSYAGAIAGLLIEATDQRIRKYFWLHARYLGANYNIPSIPWDHTWLVSLGPTTHNIDFRQIPGVCVEIPCDPTGLKVESAPKSLFERSRS